MTVHDAESSHVDSGEWLEQYQMRWLTAQVSVQSHWKVSTVPEFAYVVLPLDGPPDVRWAAVSVEKLTVVWADASVTAWEGKKSDVKRYF